MAYEILTKIDLHKIAILAGLKDSQLYVEYMKKRHPHANGRYAMEWAERFKSGDPTAYMDVKSVKAYQQSIKKLRKVV